MSDDYVLGGYFSWKLVAIGLLISGLLFSILLGGLPALHNGKPVQDWVQATYNFFMFGWGFFNVLTGICVIGFGFMPYFLWSSVRTFDLDVPFGFLKISFGVVLGIVFGVVLGIVLDSILYPAGDGFKFVTLFIFILGVVLGVVLSIIFWSVLEDIFSYTRKIFG